MAASDDKGLFAQALGTHDIELAGGIRLAGNVVAALEQLVGGQQVDEEPPQATQKTLSKPPFSAIASAIRSCAFIVILPFDTADESANVYCESSRQAC